MNVPRKQTTQLDANHKKRTKPDPSTAGCTGSVKLDSPWALYVTDLAIRNEWLEPPQVLPKKRRFGGAEQNCAIGAQNRSNSLHPC